MRGSLFMKRAWILVPFVGLVVNGIAGNRAFQRANVALTFEPNRGQASPQAEFVAKGTGYYLTLDKFGSRMVLRQGSKAADVRTHLVAENAVIGMTGTDALPGQSSYFRGKDASKWITGLPNFAKVKAIGVYPGIDLLYYGTQSKLEYDFIVAPGADAGRIRMVFDGVSKLSTNRNGDLVLVTSAGEIIEHKPVIYQTISGVRQPVSGSFRIDRNQVGFTLGKYDRSSELVIDPVLVYSSFLGGGDDDYGNAVAADSSGNMYETGVTYSTSAGDGDVLARKISPDGSAFLYTADLGGSGDDVGFGIAVDVNGFAYIGGRTTSGDFPTANAFQNQNYSPSGAGNAFVLGLDPTGKITFSTYIGGSYDDGGNAVALDNQGNVYLTGYTSSNDFPTSTGSFQRSRQGGADAFVAKFANDGTAIYSTYIGGGSDDEAYAIAVDGSGNAYIAGYTYSDSFPQVNAPYQHSRHGGQEGFVSEVKNDGSGLVFSTFIGGSADDLCNGIALDPSGNVYVVGTTGSSDLPIPNRSYNTGYNGGASDIFVAKYAPAGQSIAWTTFLGSHGTEDGNSIAVDANGNVYIAGDSNSDQYPVTRDATQGSRGGGYDAVFSVLDTNGLTLSYSTFYGGKGDDSASSLAVDASKNVYLTGSTSSGNLFVSSNAVQGTPGGGNADAFLAKISVAGSAIAGVSAAADPVVSNFAAPQAVAVPVFGRASTESKGADFTVASEAAVSGKISAQSIRKHGRGAALNQSRKLSR